MFGLDKRLQNHPGSDEAIAKIEQALEALRFGSVEVTVHDGRIVQIERREKVRVEPSCPS